MKRRMGFLYKGYKEHLFFWELVKLFLKYMLMAISVFLKAASPY